MLVLVTVLVVTTGAQAAGSEALTHWDQEALVEQSGTSLFGWDVEADGARAIVSTPSSEGGQPGNVTVWERSGLAWTVVEELEVPGERTPGFGESLDREGDRLAVGDVDDDEGEAGRAHVYRQEDGRWTHEVTVQAVNGTTRDEFGEEVAIDGDWLAVGAESDSQEADDAGAVHLYERRADGWTHVARLTPPDPGSWDQFGDALDLEGTTLVVGAHGKDAVYIYEDVDRSLEPLSLEHPGPEDSDWGAAVDLEGDRLAVSAYDEEIEAYLQGDVHVFERSPDGWVERARVVADDPARGDQFGTHLDLEGSSLAVDSDAAPSRVFQHENGSWVLEDRLTHGFRVELAENTTFVGLPWNDEGALRVFGADREPDRLSDREEQAHGTDPLDPDTDDDGLDDVVEIETLFTDPLDPDTDGDGVRDDRDDQDGDDLSNVDELDKHGTDPVDPDTDQDRLDDGRELLETGTDPLEEDTDGDWIDDGEEVLDHGTDPLDVDTDDDHMRETNEIGWAETDPKKPDSDGDGIVDGAEVFEHSTDPLEPDSDGDGLDDGAEVHDHGSSPLHADTDEDGHDDPAEVENGSDANDPASRPTSQGPTDSTFASWGFRSPVPTDHEFVAPNRAHVANGSSTSHLLKEGDLLISVPADTLWMAKVVYRPSTAVLDLSFEGESIRAEDGVGVLVWEDGYADANGVLTVRGVEAEGPVTYTLDVRNCYDYYCQSRYGAP